MKKIFKSSLYFILILMLEVIIPIFFGNLLNAISDLRLKLFASHFLCFIIPAFIFIIVTKSNPKEILRLNKISIKQFGLVILVAIASFPVMMSCSVISALFFKNNVTDFVTRIEQTPFLGLLLLMAVMPAITEEITMRGIVLSGYDKLSNFKAALITGIFFGILHLDLQQFFYTAVLGVILGYVVRITNSILSSMTVHFLINSISVTITKITSMIPQDATDKVDITQYTVIEKMTIIIVYLGIAVLFITLIYFILLKLKEVSSKQLKSV